MEDIIITVLALAVGLGFKVIEKKLKSAGKPAKAGRFKELADLSGEDGSEVFPPVIPSEDTEEFPMAPVAPDDEQSGQVIVPRPVVVEPVAPVPVVARLRRPLVRLNR